MLATLTTPVKEDKVCYIELLLHDRSIQVSNFITCMVIIAWPSTQPWSCVECEGKTIDRNDMLFRQQVKCNGCGELVNFSFHAVCFGLKTACAPVPSFSLF